MIGVRGRLPDLKADRPYSLDQLASVLGVSHRSVLRAVKTGVCGKRWARTRLPAYRVGRVYRVMGADALAWLRAMSDPLVDDEGTNDLASDAGRRRAQDVDAVLDKLGF